MGLEGARERRLLRDLIALMVFGTTLSAWLGWFWAGRAIEPVQRLAHELVQSESVAKRLSTDGCFAYLGGSLPAGMTTLPGSAS